jgi:hypothetical protein
MDENGPFVDDKHDDSALKNGDISGNMMGYHWIYPLVTLVQTWQLEIPELFMELSFPRKIIERNGDSSIAMFDGV